MRVVSAVRSGVEELLSSRACLLSVSKGHRGDEADWLW